VALPGVVPEPIASVAVSMLWLASNLVDRLWPSASVTSVTCPSPSWSYFVAWDSGSVAVVVPAAVAESLV
jgi:hypothetical protein